MTGIINPYAFASAASGPRRAWEIVITANDGNASFCGVTQIEMRESLGGANVIDEVDRVAAAFGTPAINADNAIHKGFSSELAEGYLSNTAGETHIGWDFDQQGDGDKAIVQIAIRGSWNAPDSSPTAFHLRWTADDPLGSPVWTTVQSWTTPPGWTGASDIRVFTV